MRFAYQRNAIRPIPRSGRGATCSARRKARARPAKDRGVGPAGGRTAARGDCRLCSIPTAARVGIFWPLGVVLTASGGLQRLLEIAAPAEPVWLYPLTICRTSLERVTRLGLRKLEVLRGGRQLSRHHLGDVRFSSVSDRIAASRRFAALCHKLTHALQQNGSYSINSNALNVGMSGGRSSKTSTVIRTANAPSEKALTRA